MRSGALQRGCWLCPAATLDQKVWGLRAPTNYLVNTGTTYPDLAVCFVEAVGHSAFSLITRWCAADILTAHRRPSRSARRSNWRMAARTFTISQVWDGRQPEHNRFSDDLSASKQRRPESGVGNDQCNWMDCCSSFIYADSRILAVPAVTMKGITTDHQ